MGNEVKIVESVFDNFQVERTFTTERDGATELHAMVSGVECLVDAKPSHLTSGLVFCQPIDPRLAKDWPVYTDVEVNGHPERWWNLTDQAELVRALVDSGRASERR
jgi:hypothetical protein